MYLFLDDVRTIEQVYKPNPEDVWKVVKNYDEFCGFIEYHYEQFKTLPEFISFDHDLADEHYRPSMYDADEHYSNYYHDGTFKEKTGYECVRWLINFCLDKSLELPQCRCHSMNPVGRKNIESLIHSFKYREKLPDGKN